MTNFHIAGLVIASALGTTGAATVAKWTLFTDDPKSTLVADPRITTAKSIRDRVIDQESKIAKRIEKVRVLLNKTSETKLPDTKLTQEELKKLCQPLIASGDDALSELHQLIEDTLTMQRELKHAPDGYRQVAKSWRSRAEDYKNPGLKDLTLKYASDSEMLATVYQSRFDQYAADLKELEKLVPFIRETQASVLDFMLYVEQNPDYGATNPTLRFRTYLALYAKAHASFLSIVTDYLKVMRTQIPIVEEPKK